MSIMKLMDHPNIIKLFETLEDDTNIYLAMEICDGGELFDRIIASEDDPSKHLTEIDAAVLMKQILRATWYIHDKDVIHRDLKPENCLLSSKDELTGLKIIDFGTSRTCSKDQVLTTKTGTPYYIAPEVLRQRYHVAADVWSVGVIMYVLLCGRPPFGGESDAEIHWNVKKGEFTMDTPEFETVSQDAKVLIPNLLKKDAKTRSTAAEALHHVWIQEKAPKATKNVLSYSVVNSLRSFRAHSKFKKAVLFFIAHHLDEKRLGSLPKIFEQLDENGDGLLTPAEIQEGYAKAGLDKMPADFLQILESLDADGSGAIDYSEFLAASLDSKIYTQEDVCLEAFRLFDKDGDGSITPVEIAEIMNAEQEMIDAETMKDLMLQTDTNGDGTIDFKEFLVMMRSMNG